MKQSFMRIVAWARAHPWIAAAIVGAVGLAAYLATKNKGTSKSKSNALTGQLPAGSNAPTADAGIAPLTATPPIAAPPIMEPPLFSTPELLGGGVIGNYGGNYGGGYGDQPGAHPPAGSTYSPAYTAPSMAAGVVPVASGSVMSMLNPDGTIPASSYADLAASHPGIMDLKQEGPISGKLGSIGFSLSPAAAAEFKPVSRTYGGTTPAASNIVREPGERPGSTSFTISAPAPAPSPTYSGAGNFRRAPLGGFPHPAPAPIPAFRPNIGLPSLRPAAPAYTPPPPSQSFHHYGENSGKPAPASRPPAPTYRGGYGGRTFRR